MEMTGDYVPTSKYMAELKKKLSTDPSELSEDEIQILASAYEEYQAKHGQDESTEEVES